MNQFDHQNATTDIQENIELDMMKQHISNGLSFQYSTNYTDGDTSSLVEHAQDENLPIVYKKRGRCKFTQEQVDILEATFQQHRYPTIDMIDDIVEQLNLPTQKITVWFQNRRARLKKSQQKLDDRQSFERDVQTHHDSGIHLDEDTSRSSSTSPPSYQFGHAPSIGYTPSTSPYYLSNPHQTFYNPMWQNFHYPLIPSPFQSTMSATDNFPYHFGNYNSPFVFQDISNYQYQTEFHGQS